MNDAERFGAKARAYRRLQDLSQERVAKSTGISQSALSRIERGKLSPSREVAEKIAAIVSLPGGVPK